MPTPPKKGESQSKFMSRCMRFMNKNHPDNEQTQNVAVCFSYWRKKHGGKKPKK